MSVVGVGVDVVDLARFARTLARDAEHGDALRRRLFDDDEADLPVRSLAARFAAKEALAKALGAPPGLRWRDARVRTGEHGAPHLELSGTVAARARALGVGAVHVSLSHDGGIATAFVVAERAEDVVAERAEGVVAERAEGVVAERAEDVVAERAEDVVAERAEDVRPGDAQDGGALPHRPEEAP